MQNKKELMAFKPTNPHIPSKGKKINITKPHFPSSTTQAERLGPTFKYLRDVMDRKVVMQQDMQGVDPEFVLVFEVVGSVSNFVKAAKNAGMEWMFERDWQVDSDEDFYTVRDDGTHKASKIASKLYMVLTNKQAMQQMLSLWRIYTGKGNEKFPRGLTPFREVFAQLKIIRKWDRTDRFEETGVVEIWKELLESKPSSIKFEIELWYRKSLEKREESQEVITKILGQYHGKVVHSSVYPEIGFHGLIAECPADEVQRMIDEQNHELLNAEQIMTIRASGQTIAKIDIDNTAFDDQYERPSDLGRLPTEPPVIALLDGVPLANHELLKNRINLYDPEDFESSYQVSNRSHGTAMASLIIHGDLHKPLPPLESLLYVRPIMKPNNRGGESVPEDRFFADVLHKALKEIGEESQLKSIKVVNLSIGNRNRPFIHELSPEAKMIDWLSEKYNLLVIISSGNNSRNITLPMLYGKYAKLSNEEKLKEIYKNIWEDQSSMRILSPAESINGICVGASHFDYSNPKKYFSLHDPIFSGYPSHYSCFGGGYKGSIKPDLIMSGGKQLFNVMDVSCMQAKLSPNFQSSTNSPGQLSASCTNGLKGCIGTQGTSNSAALASRFCAEFLKNLRKSHGLDVPPEYESVAIKAMLVHCCSWGGIGKTLHDKFVPQLPRLRKKEVLKWIGYGYPNPEISFFCTDQRVTLVGYGELPNGMQSEFNFPLPSCLISKAVSKRLTITLAWLSPIAPCNQDYRLAKLSFRTKSSLIAKDISDSDERAAKRGTVQHEVFVGKQASTYLSGTNLEIVVSCKKEERLTYPVKYVLMATLEVSPEVSLPIYEEIKSSLAQQVEPLKV